MTIMAFCIRCDNPAWLRIDDGVDNADALCTACRVAEDIDREAGKLARARQLTGRFRLPRNVRARKPLARTPARV